MEDNCFTILCWFLPHINMNQPQVYTFPLPLEPFSHVPPHPAPLGCHRALSWAPCVSSNVPLAICFTRGDVYISMLPSQFVPSSPSPAMFTICFLCLPFCSCPANRFIGIIFLDYIYIYALIYDICFYLCNFYRYRRVQILRL